MVLIVISFHLCFFIFLFSSFSCSEVYLGKIKIRVLFSFIFSRYSFIVITFCESLGFVVCAWEGMIWRG